MAEEQELCGGQGERGRAQPVAAATVILLRATASGIETLMLRRDARLEFAAGMWVFPGGRVDHADRTGLAPDDELGAARRAAVREAREEAGLVVTPASMVPFSHWTPPAIAPKRFFTWFFVGEAPAGTVVIDRAEIQDHAWMRPADALRERDAGSIGLTPPTWVTLYELSQWADPKEALGAAGARRPERFVTRVALTDEGAVALWHGDAGYDDADAAKPGPRHRLVMGSRWRYERTVWPDDAGGPPHR
jgi:8-oxo-dGTP pyrophosphatase MutT (NUDIX family)